MKAQLSQPTGSRSHKVLGTDIPNRIHGRTVKIVLPGGEIPGIFKINNDRIDGQVMIFNVRNANDASYMSYKDAMNAIKSGTLIYVN